MATTKASTSDRDFPGKGNIKCKICGIAVVKHRIGRCPFADDAALFYGPTGRIRRTHTELEGEDEAWMKSTQRKPSSE